GQRPADAARRVHEQTKLDICETDVVAVRRIERRLRAGLVRETAVPLRIDGRLDRGLVAGDSDLPVDDREGALRAGRRTSGREQRDRGAVVRLRRYGRARLLEGRVEPRLCTGGILDRQQG